MREEAAYSLGSLMEAIRHPGTRRGWGEKVGPALLAYVTTHIEDNLFFARESLGSTGYEPARSYLEELARNASGNRKESAERGLSNLDRAALALAQGSIDSRGGRAAGH